MNEYIPLLFVHFSLGQKRKGVFFMYVEFNENEKFAKKNADIADTPDSFKSAGYLLKEDELIIDIDCIEKKVIKKIIEIFKIKTQIVWTDRGAHFYFKKPRGFNGGKKVCPLGFEVEYKHIKNTKAIAIKRNGQLRDIENHGVREELPEMFYSRKHLNSLVGMDENEGRNDALFKHRMKIHDLDNWKSILQFINNHIFATSLEEDEFQQVSRDGVETKAEKNKEPEVADSLLKKYKVVSYQGNLYWFENGQFIQDQDKLKRLVFDEVGLKKTRYVDEVIKQMEYRAKIIKPNKAFDIKLQNGILRDGEFIGIDYQEFTPYCIDIPYNENADPVPIVDEYINHLTNHDEDYRKKLLEIMAHPLIIDKNFKRMLAKFFIFVGDGGNGKGTLLLIIREILGYQNCSALSIKNMTDERYFTTMQGKLVNLGDDVQDEAINHEQMKVLKNISTCDYVATRNLFEQSKDIELTLSLIFTSNHILKSFEKGESYRRRVDWCPMYGKPKKKDKHFIEKLTTPEALEYWMKLIVEAYMRLYQNEGFTESEMVTKFNEKYHENNNTVLQYLADYKKEHFVGMRSPEAYETYENWANENGLNVQSRKLFVQSIFEVFGLIILPKKINGKTAKVFQEAEK
jgi:putative DNA primase/helicase